MRSRNSYLPSSNGILRTSSSSDSEPLSVETDQLDSFSSMIVKNTWSSTNPTTDWEDSPSSPRGTPRESQRRSWRERSRKPEQVRERKCWPLENAKPEPISRRPNKNILRRSSLPDLPYFTYILIHQHSRSLIDPYHFIIFALLKVWLMDKNRYKYSNFVCLEELLPHVQLFVRELWHYYLKLYHQRTYFTCLWVLNAFICNCNSGIRGCNFWSRYFNLLAVQVLDYLFEPKNWIFEI